MVIVGDLKKKKKKIKSKIIYVDYKQLCMEKQQLVIKVKGFTGGIITGVVFCLVFFIAFLLAFILVEQQLSFFIMMLVWLGGSIPMICVLVRVLRQPKVMLEYDDTYLYFNEYKKTTKIPIKEIASVESLKHSVKGQTFEFGVIKIIKISGFTYNIGRIYYVDKVRDTIINLINKN